MPRNAVIYAAIVYCGNAGNDDRASNSPVSFNQKSILTWKSELNKSKQL